MKKKILTWAMLLMTVSSFSFANKGDDLNIKIATSFKKDFAGAREIKWETGKTFVKLTFILNEQIMFAYYTENGDFMAVSRNILSNHLPLSLLIKLKRDYADYWITDLFEIDSDNEISYYITLENSGLKLTLKSNSSQGWEAYKKETKMD
jgi:hypothetical protein